MRRRGQGAWLISTFTEWYTGTPYGLKTTGYRPDLGAFLPSTISSRSGLELSSSVLFLIASLELQVLPTLPSSVPTLTLAGPILPQAFEVA